MSNYDLQLHTDIAVKDSNGNDLIVGDKYELYAPIAKKSEQGIGLIFDDGVGYSFTYAGTFNLGGDLYIASPDVGYARDSVPEVISADLKQCLFGEGTPHPLCPTYVVAKFVRPVTDE